MNAKITNYGKCRTQRSAKRNAKERKEIRIVVKGAKWKMQDAKGPISIGRGGERKGELITNYGIGTRSVIMPVEQKEKQ